MSRELRLKRNLAPDLEVASEQAQDKPLIRIRGAGRRYNASSSEWAIRDGDIDIHSGDFLAITGPSGAGKSTLLNCLALLDTFDAGRYLLNGRQVDRMRLHEVQDIRGREFGFVFQSSNAIESRNVAKNVEIPLSSLGVPINVRSSLVTEALQAANILHRASQNVSLLSGGERQRVAIARSVVNKPTVLFLDEPTGNLDSANTHAVIELLQQLNQQGTTIVFVTHDDTLASSATRRVVVDDGRIVDGIPMHRPKIAGPPPKPGGLGLEKTRSSGFLRFAVQQLDAVSEAAFSLFAQPARTLVGLLSIGLGVAGLVAGVNLGVTATGQVDKLITGTSLDQITVSASAPSGAQDLLDFTPANSAKIESLDGVRSVGVRDTVSASNAEVSRFGLTQAGAYSVGVFGMTSGTFATMGIDIPTREAKLFDLSPVNSNIALLGEQAAHALGIGNDTGQSVWISGTRFDVIGIVPVSAGGDNVTNSAIISHTAAIQVGLLRQTQFVVQTNTGRGFAVGTAVPYALNPGAPAHFISSGAADLQNLRTGVATSLNGLLLALAVVFLVIAILSTSSTMTNSVLQRSGEIGLRMATGSSPGKIAGLFLAEGASLGLIGGLLGSATGVIAVLVVSSIQRWTPELDPATIALGMGAGFITGLLAAIVPSTRASRMQPALAVRK